MTIDISQLPSSSPLPALLGRAPCPEAAVFAVELGMTTPQPPTRGSIMQHTQRRITALAALWLALGSAVAAPAAPSIVEAQRAYHHGQYRESLALFERLAATHDAEAAECAGFMLLHGNQLYGPEVRRNLPRAKALLLQAARSGRPGAGFILNMLDRTD